MRHSGRPCSVSKVQGNIILSIVRPQGHSGAYVTIPQKFIGRKVIITILNEVGVKK
jgi:hypothetical protein